MRSPLYINQSFARGSQVYDFLFGEKFTTSESHGSLTCKIVNYLVKYTLTIKQVILNKKNEGRKEELWPIFIRQLFEKPYCYLFRFFFGKLKVSKIGKREG